MVVLTLMAEQRKQHFTPFLGSIGEPEISSKEIEKAAEQLGVKVIRFRMRSGPNLFGFLNIARSLKQWNIDIVHCHGYKANILMGLLPKSARKVPYVVTLHGWTSTSSFSRMHFYEWADIAFCRRADVAVAVSEAMRTHPKVRALGLKTILVQNGITSETHSQPGPVDDIAKLRSDPRFRGYVIGTICRLSPEKGVSVLINAVANVVATGRDVSLVILGDGDKREELERLARSRKVSNRVLFAGYVHQARYYLKVLDLFVLSSLTEGLPVTLLEAMQAGVPIVATHVGGVPEALDGSRCGVLVNPEDEGELAEAIIKQHDSPSLGKKLAAAAKERVKTKFSSEQMELGYRAIYEKLLGEDANSLRSELPW